jgi:hypothetical protein
VVKGIVDLQTFYTPTGRSPTHGRGKSIAWLAELGYTLTPDRGMPLFPFEYLQPFYDQTIGNGSCQANLACHNLTLVHTNETEIMNDNQRPNNAAAPAGQRRCRTRLIADTPSSMDDFGPHRRIAEAIFELIDSEPGGVAIGLEGDWGSGKSTIIKLLDGHLAESQSPRKLIVFNAWAHEGDPLRRTFLESLIHELIDHG